MPRVAIIGSGLIGRAWAMVFARAGWDAAMYDAVDGVADKALGLVAEGLDELAKHGLVADPKGSAARVRAAKSVADALDGASYVQENVPETVEAKRAIFAELDALAAPDAILASSTSAIVAEPVHRKSRRPRALPRGASGEPAASGADRRAGRRAVDRARDDRARQAGLRVDQAGADRGAPRDRGLHPQPPAGRAARRGVPAGRRGLRVAAGSRQDHQGRARPALVVHGAVRDHRAERARRHRGLLRALHRLLQAAAGKARRRRGVRRCEHREHPEGVGQAGDARATRRAHPLARPAARRAGGA